MAVIIYPGMPVLALVFGESIPVMINNLFPASWVMFGRSGVYSEEGFSLGFVLMGALMAFLILRSMAVRRRKM